jgi:hypothetical protein
VCLPLKNPSALKFVSKAEAYPSGAPFVCSTLLQPINIRLGCTLIQPTNFLAYHKKCKIQIQFYKIGSWAEKNKQMSITLKSLSHYVFDDKRGATTFSKMPLDRMTFSSEKFQVLIIVAQSVTVHKCLS